VKRILNFIAKNNKNGVVRLAQENAMNIIERTEAAGNIVNTKSKQEQIMETNNEVSVTIPINLLVESLAKNDTVINIVYDKVKEKIEPIDEGQISDYINEWFENSDNTYEIKREIEESFDDKYLTSDNVMDYIDSELDDKIQEKFDDSEALNSAWIQDNLRQYKHQIPSSLCSLGKDVWNAIVLTISEDINMYYDAVKSGNLSSNNAEESTILNHQVDNKSFEGMSTSVISLVKLIELVATNVVKKAGLVNQFNETTKVEIIDDIVPSTAFPCTHFKITTYTQEQSDAIKSFLFSNKLMQESRVAFTTKTNTLHNPL
jgi:hypothetical protein